MSGHSKWANIKHKKEKTDAQRGRMFSRIGREIMVAVREGGPDPEANSRLKDIIAKAKAANIPNDNISRSIKKAAGDTNAANFEDIWYEGYGPEGVALMVRAMTDNRNRTAGDLRHIFDKFGGNMGSSGCVSFMFEEKGQILIEKSEEIIEDELMLEAIDLGADDFKTWDEYYEILTVPADFTKVREGLEGKGYVPISAGVEMIPLTTAKISDQKHADMLEKLIDHLDELEDVQNIYNNWEQ